MYIFILPMIASVSTLFQVFHSRGVCQPSPRSRRCTFLRIAEVAKKWVKSLVSVAVSSSKSCRIIL